MLESATLEHEYRDQILDHMLAMEKATMSDSSMINTQPEIEWKMRPYLLDFLTRSHLSLRLNHETLFLAINIIDRYASQRIVFVRHYQLLGTTALWIASKYQDKKTRVPTLKELGVLCSYAYDNTMFTQMELHILNTLEWSIGHPTVDLFVDMCFQNPALQITDKDQRTKLRYMVLFLCENANYHQDMLNYPPSIIASAAFKLSVEMITLGKSRIQAFDKNESACIQTLLHHSNYPTPFLERKYSIPEFSRAYQVIIQYNLFLKQQHQKLQFQKQQFLLNQHHEHIHHQTLHAHSNIRIVTPSHPYAKPISSPTTYRHASTLGKSPANFNHLEIKTCNSNSFVGYMTPPFTPEESEIPLVQKRHYNSQTQPSSRAVSAQQQLIKQQKLDNQDDESENDDCGQEQQTLYLEYNEEEDEDYVDDENWEEEEDMAYEYGSDDESFDPEEKEQLETTHIMDSDDDGDDEMSDNDSIGSLNSTLSGAKTTGTRSSTSSMPSTTSFRISKGSGTSAAPISSFVDGNSLFTFPQNFHDNTQQLAKVASYGQLKSHHSQTQQQLKSLSRFQFGNRQQDGQKPSRHASMFTFSNPSNPTSHPQISKSASLHIEPLSHPTSIRLQIPQSLSHHNRFL